MATQRVFVYGTLLKGERNHALLQGATLCGSHRTVPIYRLFHLGNYPGVRPGGQSAILGEVYCIDGRILRALDRLEAYPRVYTRKLIPTPWGVAWIYLYQEEGSRARQIPSGDWRGQGRQLGVFRL
ncbi:MAG: gamma-glutamylcyclotransferase [Gammaproteobacteria bacterium]|nr:gamma-glutamylcyclotransferase [Gammaproteobacteria bacterium]